METATEVISKDEKAASNDATKIALRELVRLRGGGTDTDPLEAAVRLIAGGDDPYEWAVRQLMAPAQLPDRVGEPKKRGRKAGTETPEDAKVPDVEVLMSLGACEGPVRAPQWVKEHNAGSFPISKDGFYARLKRLEAYGKVLKVEEATVPTTFYGREVTMKVKLYSLTADWDSHLVNGRIPGGAA